MKRRDTMVNKQEPCDKGHGLSKEQRSIGLIRHAQRGMTLIEIMVVVVIISLVAGVVGVACVVIKSSPICFLR